MQSVEYTSIRPCCCAITVVLSTEVLIRPPICQCRHSFGKTRVMFCQAPSPLESVDREPCLHDALHVQTPPPRLLNLPGVKSVVAPPAAALRNAIITLLAINVFSPNMASNPSKPPSGALSLYANLLDPTSSSAPGTISSAPVIYKQPTGGSPSPEDEAAKKQVNAGTE